MTDRTDTEGGTLSTHVLDAALGQPAADLRFTVRTADGTALDGITDTDGRARVPAHLPPGPSSITFDTGAWFAAQQRTTFHPEVQVQFLLDAGEHHHVALLLSPFAYTTYRGS
ncbi:hydroxyisourate hydrolase [Rhodococcus sp. GA1]|uniref:hydroxyisourate hydrolase n=1 Tax=Rhodococcus sp. GA1 TaxID=2942275 RepID=UPI0020CC1F6B|nr:hydroxyisourate hydrolase [Rhodococcus sp. GA1]